MALGHWEQLQRVHLCSCPWPGPGVADPSAVLNSDSALSTPHCHRPRTRDLRLMCMVASRTEMGFFTQAPTARMGDCNPRALWLSCYDLSLVIGTGYSP